MGDNSKGTEDNSEPPLPEQGIDRREEVYTVNSQSVVHHTPSRFNFLNSTPFSQTFSIDPPSQARPGSAGSYMCLNKDKNGNMTNNGTSDLGDSSTFVSVWPTRRSHGEVQNEAHVKPGELQAKAAALEKIESGAGAKHQNQGALLKDSSGVQDSKISGTLVINVPKRPALPPPELPKQGSQAEQKMVSPLVEAKKTVCPLKEAQKIGSPTEESPIIVPPVRTTSLQASPVTVRGPNKIQLTAQGQVEKWDDNSSIQQAKDRTNKPLSHGSHKTSGEPLLVKSGNRSSSNTHAVDLNKKLTKKLSEPLPGDEDEEEETHKAKKGKNPIKKFFARKKGAYNPSLQSEFQSGNDKEKEDSKNSKSSQKMFKIKNNEKPKSKDDKKTGRLSKENIVVIKSSGHSLSDLTFQWENSGNQDGRSKPSSDSVLNSKGDNSGESTDETKETSEEENDDHIIKHGEDSSDDSDHIYANYSSAPKIKTPLSQETRSNPSEDENSVELITSENSEDSLDAMNNEEIDDEEEIYVNSMFIGVGQGGEEASSSGEAPSKHSDMSDTSSINSGSRGSYDVNPGDDMVYPGDGVVHIEDGTAHPEDGAVHTLGVHLLVGPDLESFRAHDQDVDSIESQYTKMSKSKPAEDAAGGTFLHLGSALAPHLESADGKTKKIHLDTKSVPHLDSTDVKTKKIHLDTKSVPHLESADGKTKKIHLDTKSVPHLDSTDVKTKKIHLDTKSVPHLESANGKTKKIHLDTKSVPHLDSTDDKTKNTQLDTKSGLQNTSGRIDKPLPQNADTKTKVNATIGNQGLLIGLGTSQSLKVGQGNKTESIHNAPQTEPKQSIPAAPSHIHTSLGIQDGLMNSCNDGNLKNNLFVDDKKDAKAPKSGELAVSIEHIERFLTSEGAATTKCEAKYEPSAISRDKIGSFEQISPHSASVNLNQKLISNEHELESSLGIEKSHMRVEHDGKVKKGEDVKLEIEASEESEPLYRSVNKVKAKFESLAQNATIVKTDTKSDGGLVKVDSSSMKLKDNMHRTVSTGAEIDGMMNKPEELPIKLGDASVHVHAKATTFGERETKIDGTKSKSDGQPTKNDSSLININFKTPKLEGVVNKVDGKTTKLDDFSTKVDGSPSLANITSTKPSGVGAKSDVTQINTHGVSVKPGAVLAKTKVGSPNTPGISTKFYDSSNKNDGFVDKDKSPSNEVKNTTKLSENNTKTSTSIGASMKFNTVDANLLKIMANKRAEEPISPQKEMISAKISCEESMAHKSPPVKAKPPPTQPKPPSWKTKDLLKKFSSQSADISVSPEKPNTPQLKTQRSEESINKDLIDGALKELDEFIDRDLEKDIDHIQINQVNQQHQVPPVHENIVPSVKDKYLSTKCEQFEKKDSNVSSKSQEEDQIGLSNVSSKSQEKDQIGLSANTNILTLQLDTVNVDHVAPSKSTTATLDVREQLEVNVSPTIHHNETVNKGYDENVEEVQEIYEEIKDLETTPSPTSKRFTMPWKKKDSKKYSDGKEAKVEEKQKRRKDSKDAGDSKSLKRKDKSSTKNKIKTKDKETRRKNKSKKKNKDVDLPEQEVYHEISEFHDRTTGSSSSASSSSTSSSHPSSEESDYDVVDYTDESELKIDQVSDSNKDVAKLKVQSADSYGYEIPAKFPLKKPSIEPNLQQHGATNLNLAVAPGGEIHSATPDSPKLRHPNEMQTLKQDMDFDVKLEANNSVNSTPNSTNRNTIQSPSNNNRLDNSSVEWSALDVAPRVPTRISVQRPKGINDTSLALGSSVTLPSASSKEATAEDHIENSHEKESQNIHKKDSKKTKLCSDEPTIIPSTKNDLSAEISLQYAPDSKRKNSTGKLIKADIKTDIQNNNEPIKIAIPEQSVNKSTPKDTPDVPHSDKDHLKLKVRKPFTANVTSVETEHRQLDPHPTSTSNVSKPPKFPNCEVQPAVNVSIPSGIQSHDSTLPDLDLLHKDTELSVFEIPDIHSVSRIDDDHWKDYSPLEIGQLESLNPGINTRRPSQGLHISSSEFPDHPLLIPDTADRVRSMPPMHIAPPVPRARATLQQMTDSAPGSKIHLATNVEAVVSDPVQPNSEEELYSDGTSSPVTSKEPEQEKVEEPEQEEYDELPVRMRKEDRPKQNYDPIVLKLNTFGVRSVLVDKPDYAEPWEGSKLDTLAPTEGSSSMTSPLTGVDQEDETPLSSASSDQGSTVSIVSLSTPNMEPSRPVEFVHIPHSRHSDKKKHKDGRHRKPITMRSLSDLFHRKKKDRGDMEGSLRSDNSDSDPSSYTTTKPDKKENKRKAEVPDKTDKAKKQKGKSPKHREDMEMLPESEMRGRPLCKLVAHNNDGTTTIQMARPQSGPLGIFFSKDSLNEGLMVKSFLDKTARRMFSGILSVGDEIVEIDCCDISYMTLDEVKELIQQKETMLLTTRPAPGH